MRKRAFTRVLQRGVRSVREAGFKGVCMLLALMIFITSFVGGSSEATSVGGAAGFEEALAQEIAKEGSYGAYEKEHADKAKYAGEDIVVAGADYSDTNTDMSDAVFGSFEGVENAAVSKIENAGQDAGEEVYMTYRFTVPSSGMYTIQLQYYPIAKDSRFPVEGKGSPIERAVYIDGEMPFNEAGYVTFDRVWIDEVPTGDYTDQAGNEIRPPQVEAPEWRTVYFNDKRGVYYNPFLFYLEEGEHEIKLVVMKEPMLIGKLVVGRDESAPSYAEVKAEYAAKGYKAATGEGVRFEAERSYQKSEASLYAYYNRSSPVNSTFDKATGESTSKFQYKITQLNMMGGEKWQTPGQWISWQFTVPESGLYAITMRARQNINRGRVSCRYLTIDGELPFEEAKQIEIDYSSDFQMYTVQGKDGEVFEFYFEAGRTYTMELMVALGSIDTIVRRIDDSLAQLMAVYRSMLRLFENAPDTNRTYDFEKVMPKEYEMVGMLAKELHSIADAYYEASGERNADYSQLERIAKSRLERIYKRPDEAAKQFTGLRDDVGAIATLILGMQKQPLEIDYFMVAPAEAEIPKAEAGFFANMGHEFMLFFYSFITDYSAIGGDSEAKDPLTVWFGTAAVGAVVGGGREQVQILKQMIDDDFMVNFQIPTKLQFIAMAALLPATLAGRGPDVALQIGHTEPVNYAMRGAVVNLAQYADYPEVEERFFENTVTPFKYLGGVYALPETQDFPVMFYRTDIIEELGLKLPDTWADVKDILPELQNNYMTFAFPSGIANYQMYVFQRGVDLYRGEGELYGIASNLDSTEAIDAFIAYTDMYRSYKVEKTVDFQTRFRRGEAPIGIANYTAYNQMSISAPEIRGLWKFALVPGVERVDENGNSFIDRSVATSGTSCIVMTKSNQQENGWEFLKWWTSETTQTRYATEIEGVVGTASRYPAANKSVMYKQQWGIEEFNTLMAQREWAQGVPQVPGGYFTDRHMDNAFNRVVNDVYDARETLLDYMDDINMELTTKRKEMGLVTINDLD